MENKIFKILVFVFLIYILTFRFQKNILVINDYYKRWFETFQQDSEALVLAKISNDKYNFNSNTKYGLLHIKGTPTERYEHYMDIFNNGNKVEITIQNRTAQVGLQGYIFSFLYNKIHIPLGGLHLFCSMTLAIVLVIICYLLKEKYGNLFAIVFYVTFFLSQWITNFARNLYWVEFTWFLPLMFVLLLEKTKNKKVFLPLIFLSVFIKCLCGYEYLSTILLSAISFLIVEFFINKEQRIEIFKDIFVIGIICVSAFLLVFSIHSYMKGNGNLINGAKSIINEDVLRRTIGTNADLFEDERVKESINATYMSVIQKYFEYDSIMLGLEGKNLYELTFFAFMIILYNFFKEKDNGKRDFVMFFVFEIVTLSWFVLGKAHSDIHTKLNYVLWYFGYVQICIYVIIKFIIQMIKECDVKKL